MKRKTVSRPKVLVIEDDPGHQRIFEIYLNRAGAACECCFDGRSGLQKAFDHHYDLIIIDIHIPELDGFAVATRLRDDHDKTPLIAVTALTVESLKKNALKVGFNEFLRKPISEDELSRILRQYTHFKPPPMTKAEQ
jgi:DNA-binding response OmpR family regulator